MNDNKIGISSCLVGICCRYDGNYSKNLKKYQNCVHFCPEVLGGLSVPRICCEIDKGNGFDVILGNAKVIGADGTDYSRQFLDGARKALEICQVNGIETVILKEKSPSCGYGFVYNNGVLVSGAGVTAAMLINAGIKVISDVEEEK